MWRANGIRLSSRYGIAETDTFRKAIRKNKALDAVYGKVRDVVYPVLRREPHFGPNIKRLKAEFSDFYRYRVGEYRLFYTINEEDTVVIVADLRSRQQSYRRR